jgi:P4 family phage/plasmid primase-like protien
MSYEFNFTNKKNEFYNFLKFNYSVTPDNYSTHTSIGDPPGAWHISDEYLDYFYTIYGEVCFKFNVDCHLTERHKEVSPILIDLDFRYDLEHPDRLFDIEFIKNIVKLYNRIIKESYVEIPDNLLESYVLLKTNPIKDKDKYKDGIHIVYPYLVTKPDIQKWIRKTLIKDWKNELKEIFSKIHCTNEFSDIFDDKVIYDTNWQLYGSKKPGNIPYKLVYILDSDCNIIKNEYLINDSELNLSNEKKQKVLFETNKKLIKLFSIRNKIETKLILNNQNTKMDKWLKDNAEKLQKHTQNYRTATKGPKRSISELKIFGRNGVVENLDYIKELVNKCLSEYRSDKFDSWINVGILLHNIDYTLLDTWISFSKKSSKYKDSDCQSDCQERWDRLPTMNNKKTHTVNPELGIGSLVQWSKEDNFEEYKKIRAKYFTTVEGNSCLEKLLYKSQDAAHTDLANVIYRYFNGFGLSEENRFMCYNISKKLWVEYKATQHKWIEDTEDNAGHCIRQTFDTDIYKLYVIDYMNTLQKKHEKAIQDDDEQQQKRIEDDKIKIMKLAKQLKITGFRDTLLKECSNKFHLKDCRELLDTNLDLIGFVNGVYDLENGVFREGRPSDFISLSTNLEYTDYTHNSSEIIELKKIISQILPIEPVREYFLKILSSCLSGKQYFEKFFVLTGSGSNGKSKLIDLIQSSLGDYYHQMNVAALCSRRGSSQAADPELAMLRGRRFVAFQEPSPDEPINVGKMKEWTGGDTIQCRELYKGPIKFKGQAKWFLICNDIPVVSSDDDGTWRRLTVINFPSKFIPRGEMAGRKYEFERINNMNEKLEELKEAFMWLLLDYFKEFKELMKSTGLIEPDEIIEATNNERKKNNPIKQFIDDRIVYSSNRNDKFNITEIYGSFKNYMTESGHNPKTIPKRAEFGQRFNIEYVNIIKTHSNRTIEIKKFKNEWNNVTYIMDTNNNEQDEPNILQDEPNILQDSDTEDEYTNSIELITEEDVLNMNDSDSD